MYAHHQATLAELTGSVLTDTDLSALMRRAVTLVGDTLAVPYSAIWELLPDRSTLVLRFGVGWEEGAMESMPVEAAATSPIGSSVLGLTPVMVADWPSETRFRMIFQDPSASLNPRMRVRDIVMEPLLYNKIAKGDDALELVRNTLKLVGLQEHHMNRYPHAFSGGQRQRIGIARSLVCHPELIVCDESVSALDVSIQAQILNLLKDLQKGAGGIGLSYLFIAHDLAVVEHISDRVAVLYVGKIVELAKSNEVFSQPRHPYTEALLSAVPLPDPTRKSSRIILEGEVANPAHPPSGCYFHPRCPYATEQCKNETPQWREISPEHFVLCHHADQLQLKGMV